MSTSLGDTASALPANPMVDTVSDEMTAKSDCASPPSTPELIDVNGSSSDSADSDPEDSPVHSLFSDEPYEPDLRGPDPGEVAQYRGRPDPPLRESKPLPQHPPAHPPAHPHAHPHAPAHPHLHPQRNEAPPANRRGGRSSAVAVGTVPFNNPENPPNPPEHH